MAYDETLAQRVRDCLSARDGVVEKKMFGGLCYMVTGHMCCGIINDRLMARVGPDRYEAALAQDHVLPMDFTGRPMKGMVYVESPAIDTQETLAQWIGTCLEFIHSLPPKK